MTQYDKLRSKVLLQASRVLRKLKPLRSQSEKREVTNAEIELVNFQYAIQGQATDEVGVEHNEWVHDVISGFSQVEMDIYRMKFFDGATEREIAVNLGLAKTTLRRRIDEMYAKFRLRRQTEPDVRQGLAPQKP